jgi:hypothetical protein
MNLDWRKLDFSFLGVEVPLPSSDSLRASPLLFIRKKFLMRWDTWLLEPLICLFGGSEWPEKVLFSVILVWVDAEELNSCVIVVTQRCRYRNKEEQRRNTSWRERTKQVSWRGCRDEWVSGPCPSWVIVAVWGCWFQSGLSAGGEALLRRRKNAARANGADDEEGEEETRRNVSLLMLQP